MFHKGRRRRNRCNYGSYRSNSYQNQNCPKNYKNREFTEYYTNNFNSYKRRSDWDSCSSNTTYRWNSNRNNNYRNNYKYSENSCKEQDASFAEDSFEYNSFNNEDSQTKETDQIESTTTTTTKTTTTNTKNTKSISSNNNKNKNNNNNQTIKTKQFKQNKTKVKFSPKNKRQNTRNKTAFKNSKTNNNSNSEENLKNSAASKEFDSSKDSLNLTTSSIDEQVNDSEVNIESNKTDNNLIEQSKEPETTEDFNLNSKAANTLTTSIELNQPKAPHNNESEEPKTVLDNLTPTPFQDTISTSPQLPHSTATSESEHFEFHTPKISLIPISRLLATEFWESTSHDSLVVENSSKLPNTPQKTIYKPNLIKRKRNVSTCSNSSTSSQTNSATDRIVEKLVMMNKINIKNIINSSETKYDEALKTQARKRLREEIRRQLKSMNIEPPKDPICSDFVPDEIVDSIDIPDVVFDEIRKALGLELLSFNKDVHMKTIDELVKSVTAEDNGVTALTPLAEATETSSGHTVQTATSMELVESQPEKKSPNLKAPPQPQSQPASSPPHSKVKYEIKTESNAPNKRSLEKTKSSESRTKSKKLTKRKESRKSKRHRSPKKPREDVVVIISSSSSSESTSSSESSSSSTTSTSSTSSSDSESDASEKSSTSLAKRKRLKLKMDAENVVDSFEKLIFSSLSESLKERYRTKYSTSLNTKLHFISCVCTSDYNSGKFSKLQIAKVQGNLKSSDCSMALEFLMKEIVNVFNKQKQVAKMDDSNKTSRRVDSSPKRDYTKDSTKKVSSNENIARDKSSNSKTSSKLSSSSTDAVKTKSVNAATNSEKHIQQCVSKVLSLYRQEMKAAMQANETKNQPSSTQKSSATAENQAKTTQQQQQTSSSSSSSTSTTSNNEDKNAGHAKHNEDEAHLKNPINCLNQQQKQQQQHQTTQQQSVAISRDNEQLLHSSSTLAKLQQSDDTAKEMLSTQIIPIHSFCSTDYSSNVTTSFNGNLNSSILGLSSASFNQQPSFPIVDLEELKKQSPIGEVVVNNLREIDVKLMELHKRKMYLEEMVLKLQKDKMEADLLTIKLQNEKFILLNTAMTANVTTTAMKNSNTTNNSNINSSNNNMTNDNCKSKTKQNASLSSVNNIKIETYKSSDTSNVEAKKKEERPPKKNLKPRMINKTPTTKRNAATGAKRKCPPNTPTSESPKKRKRIAVSQKATTTAGTKKSLQKKAATCSKPPTATNEMSTKENTAKENTDCSTSLPTTTSPPAPSPTPPPPDPPATPEAQPPPTTEINNNPQIEDATKSPTNKSLYKNMPTGSFEGIRNPITQIRIFGEFIFTSSEDGKLYKFDVNTLKLLMQFAKHCEAITQMYLCPKQKVIYTTSLDGYIKKSSLENFALDIQSVYLQEPLQSIDIQWDTAYIGSRWGNIYTYNVETNSLADKPLCSTDSSIISIKATKEGVRKILIVSSKGNLIQLRDANSGLLLRTFDVPESINIYSLLLNDDVIYCGTQKKEIRKYDFVSGQYLGIMNCGNGAVSMQMYNNRYIFVGCYDGYIYILDKTTDKQVGRLAGSGKMILTLEIIEDKIITSAKDNTMKVIDIPSYCLKNNAKRNE